jgi:YidC/Oxa1 family membrane protein insertase
LAEYQNPQNEPGGERRLLLVFLVAFIAMLAFQPLLKKYMPAPSATQQQAAHPATAQPQTSQSLKTAASPASAPASSDVKRADRETESTVENDLYKITFTNRGAQVKSWILKKYDNDAGQPLDLVNASTAAQYGYPLSLFTYDEDLGQKLSSDLYVATRTGNQITFEYSDQELQVSKKFTFDESYVAKIETSVTYRGNPVPALPAWPAGFGDQATPAFYAATFIDYQFNKDIQRIPSRCGFSLFSRCNQAIGGATVPGPFHWAGVSDQYFAAVFIPDDPVQASMVTLNRPWSLPRNPENPDSKEKINVDVLGAAVGNIHGPTAERIYAGPKELGVLQKVPVPGVNGADNDLNGLVDFGWWGIIAKPLFLWLKWTYAHVVPNWGWAIIFQTIVISLALMPLRITQMRSMLKMQRVAPQIKSIQEKYKKYSLKDPRKAGMNEEISALYKKEGVNPVGGCLPMLATLPFIFAYYRMLGTALDLRHAHWLWIKDLSAAEPFPYILPILMVVSSLIMQRMTPQAGMDPAQQRMMTVMMPLMMGFLFFRLAAGLNLYYAVVNVIGIVQQSVMNRTHLGKEMREIMAKRARKKDK